MPDGPKRVQATFYRSNDGAEPVREWILELQPEDRKSIGADIALIEYGWPIGMPTCRPLSSGLWEVRSNISGGRIARVLFCFSNGQLVLLQGFIKKTQKTPDSDMALARSRQKDVQR
jgi:phage-related protein